MLQLKGHPTFLSVYNVQLQFVGCRQSKTPIMYKSIITYEIINIYTFT